MEGKVFVLESNNTEHKTPWSVPTKRNSTANSMLWKQLPTKYRSWLKYTPAAKDYQQIERNVGSQARTRNSNISLQYPYLHVINTELALLINCRQQTRDEQTLLDERSLQDQEAQMPIPNSCSYMKTSRQRNSDTYSQLLSVHEDFKNKTLRHYSQLLSQHLECELSWPRSFSS